MYPQVGTQRQLVLPLTLQSRKVSLMLLFKDKRATLQTLNNSSKLSLNKALNNKKRVKMNPSCRKMKDRVKMGVIMQVTNQTTCHRWLVVDQQEDKALSTKCNKQPKLKLLSSSSR